jgi:hypothetical protein
MLILVKSRPQQVKRKLPHVSVCVLVTVCFLLTLPQRCALRAQTENAQLLRGTVVLPDGTPVQGALVTASALCYHRKLSRFTTTAADGSFSFPLFATNDSDCTQYQFSAKKRDDFWMPSDEDVFSGITPEIPTVDVPIVLPSKPVQVVLRIRGGEVSFRIWEISTRRFVHAAFEIRRKPVEGKQFGSILTATGEDGSAFTRLFPPGEYTVSVTSYPSQKDIYCPVLAPATSFVAAAGIRVEETITIDVRKIKPLLHNCKP